MRFVKADFFLYQIIQLVVHAELAQARVFFSGTKKFLISANFLSHNSSGWVPTSPNKVFFQETCARYWNLAVRQNEYYPQGSLWVEEFRVQERAAEQPAAHPYVAERDIVTSKEERQVLKARLPNNSHLNMPIYSCGNTKEYLTHIVAVLCIIKQKGLHAKCRKLRKADVRQSETLKNLLKATWSRDTVSMDIDIQACKVEIEQTQQMLKESQKAHDEAIAKTYEQLRNLLSGDGQPQWARVCCKMHERDLWAGVNGQVTKGRHPRRWMSFQDCLELPKLKVFSADATKRQRFYIQQAVRKPQRATVQQHILQMGVLNDCIRYQATLEDSPQAVPMRKKGNIPFSKADLAAIMLASVPMLW
jgi:hypothetical protein